MRAWIQTLFYIVHGIRVIICKENRDQGSGVRDQRSGIRGQGSGVMGQPTSQAGGLRVGRVGVCGPQMRGTWGTLNLMTLVPEGSISIRNNAVDELENAVSI